ncbi:MAG: rhomboid family intramembrane serine protease [Armatimonadetes bacterium]|nr:rhomboid family intramembrane serine protease [Armatimonadota bacterium]
MTIIVPMGLTEKPKRLPATLTVLTISIWLMAVVQFVFLSRHEFAPTAKELWFEILSYDPTRPQWWKAVTSLLIHADFWHGIVNLAGLWLFGWFVEVAMGWQRFAFLTLIAHLLALKAQESFWLWQGHNEPSQLVGSSAIVAFSMGAFCLRFPNVGLKWKAFYGWRWGKREFFTPLWWLVAFWLIGQLWAFFFQSPYKPAVAHLTSFSFGLVVALSLGWHRVALWDRLQREAELAEREERWLAAAEIWSQISNQMPTNTFALLAASHNFLLANELSRAQEMLEKAIGQLIWDERALQRACQISSEPLIQNLPAETVFALAEQLERHHRYRESLQLFKKVEEVSKFNKAPQALLKVVELYWRLGEEAKARHALHRFWLLYGQTHWRQKATDLAAQIRWRGEQ